MTFVKGKSGNPGGRRKADIQVKDLAREYTSEAITTLVEVMRNKKAGPSARAAAASAVLDRGHGKPSQHIEANVNFLDNLSYAEQEALAAALATLAPGEESHSDGAGATAH